MSCFTSLAKPAMSIVDIFSQYQSAFVGGLLESLRLISIVWSAGLILGTICGVLGSRFRNVLGRTFAVFAFILSGIPIIVFLFWLHYPLQSMLNVVIDPYITATAALTLVNVFAVCEIVRRALVDFPEQYLIAAKVCGLDRWQTFSEVQLPLVLRQVLPGILTAQVAILQASLFASLISVDEIFRIAQRINSEIYRPVEIYTCLALLFIVVCLPLNGVALYLRHKYTRNLSE